MTTSLETARLSLRLVREADRDDLIALERDAEVMRFINGGRSTPVEGIDSDTGFRTPRGREPDVWAAIERDLGVFAGWFSLRRIGEGAAELGYRLRRGAWGRGLASEGALALVEWGFVESGLDRIMATTMAANQASRRVLEKVGLVHVRTVHKDWPDPLPGSEMGDVKYEIAREAWKITQGPHRK
ncbi:MAG TPA: GNAT family N-acetyltransferase [Caulobacteraceae bacterium]|jgi:RimJ/RimL family protein N-acetyltransferase|nr:GNAT family N-acetyltransferase [Caulobacteraceae bacterium]